ncbi:unnamed protein product [Amoebophrya sp. A120]|nr:unnamed protein product [Amoebophrya sp. A120]|eukprot:GSA120T00022876001.1
MHDVEDKLTNSKTSHVEDIAARTSNVEGKMHPTSAKPLYYSRKIKSTKENDYLLHLHFFLLEVAEYFVSCTVSTLQSFVKEIRRTSLYAKLCTDIQRCASTFVHSRFVASSSPLLLPHGLFFFSSRRRGCDPGDPGGVPPGLFSCQRGGPNNGCDDGTSGTCDKRKNATSKPNPRNLDSKSVYC